MMAVAQCPPGASAADDVASLKATARQLHAPLAAICKLRNLTPEQKRGCEELLYRTSPEARLEGDDDDARPATGVTGEHIASAIVFGEDHPNSDITNGEKSVKAGVSYVYEVTDNTSGRKFQVAGLDSDFDPRDITTDYNVDASIFGAQCKTGGKYADDFETCGTKYGALKVVHDDGRRANYYMFNPLGYERTFSRAVGPVAVSAQAEIDSPGVGYVHTTGERGGTFCGIGGLHAETNVLFTVKKLEVFRHAVLGIDRFILCPCSSGDGHRQGIRVWCRDRPQLRASSGVLHQREQRDLRRRGFGTFPSVRRKLRSQNNQKRLQSHLSSSHSRADTR